MELQTSGKPSSSFPQKAQDLRIPLKYKIPQKPGTYTNCSYSNAWDTEPPPVVRRQANKQHGSLTLLP